MEFRDQGSRIGESFESGKVGTAFDYVARAQIERTVGAERITNYPLACELGLAMLIDVVAHSEDAKVIADSIRSNLSINWTNNARHTDKLRENLRANIMRSSDL
ncbi:hypothetical protein [Acidithrix sp. C25]|uniref:hypothetical protein n=1 Tax=Acidithrix sp. C25 TaxID=1671482 RepID=UPI00191B9A84|nr:hypothetical protein [Acidithrix sp. C25]